MCALYKGLGRISLTFLLVLGCISSSVNINSVRTQTKLLLWIVKPNYEPSMVKSIDEFSTSLIQSTLQSYTSEHHCSEKQVFNVIIYSTRTFLHYKHKHFRIIPFCTSSQWLSLYAGRVSRSSWEQLNVNFLQNAFPRHWCRLLESILLCLHYFLIYCHIYRAFMPFRTSLCPLWLCFWEKYH